MYFPKPNRRQFLTTLGLSVAAGAGWCGYRSTQAKIPVGLIGCGKRGRQLAKTIVNSPSFSTWGELKCICDVNQASLLEVKKNVAPHAESYTEYQGLLDRKDLAAVIIATPDHWHVPMTAEAIMKGKAVYCEKPMSLTIEEGQRLVRLVQKHDGIVQIGTQQRSHWRFQKAIEHVRNGDLGTIKTILIDLPENLSGGPFQKKTVPTELDWNNWLGPAPLVDYVPERLNFRGWYEYSGGKITDWGAHHVDIAHLALGDTSIGPLTVLGNAELPECETGYNVPHQYMVDMMYPNNVKIVLRSSPSANGIQFVGDTGNLYVSRSGINTSFETSKQKQNQKWTFPQKSNSITTSMFSYEVLHLHNFFEAIEHGTPLRSDVVSHHNSITACHLANIAIRSRELLKWSPENQTFQQASSRLTAYLSRQSRLNRIIKS